MSATGGARARLFVALDLPAAVREELAAWGRRVADSSGDGAGGGLRLIPADALHVTLCFLGWREEDQAEGIAALALDAAPEDGPAPRLALGAATWLPPRRPRVLAVDLVDADGALAALQARVSDALAGGAGYAPEKRLYRPHVTVARVPRGARPRGRDALPAPAPLEFEAPAVTLYRSRLAREGATYDALARVELGGA